MQQGRIILDAVTPEEDRDWSAEEHMALFDHYPIEGRGGRCQHPIHDAMRRIIDGPGVQAEVQFDPTVIISTDSDGHIAEVERYDAEVDRAKGIIADIEAKQAFFDARDPQRPLKRAERRRMQREMEKIARKAGTFRE